MNGVRRRPVLVGIAAAGCTVLPLRAEPTAAERARIDRLIAFVAAQKDCEFIRNGSAYDASDAAQFLRGKFDKMGDGVNTAQQFIEQIASRSSISGEPYLMRWRDGRTAAAAQVLQAELKKMPR